MLNVIKRNWKIPSKVVKIVEEIQRHIQQQQIHIQHIYREGNQLVDFIANQAINDKTTLVYTHFHQLPKRSKQILNIDKAQIPMLRLRSKPIKV